MKENKYLSKEYTNSLRGIFAVVVVVHHLYQYSGLFRRSYIGVILQLSGFISVAMFFFFSGYGLMLSSKKERYLDDFWAKRFIPLYIFYVFLIILYSIWVELVENSFSLKLFFQSFFWGKTIVTNGWYLQTLFLFYLLYIIIFKATNRPKLQIQLFSVCIVVYCAFCSWMDLGITWYQNIPCMLFGMVYCQHKDNMDMKLRQHSGIMFVVCGALFSVCFLLSALTEIPVIFDMLYSLFFVGTVIVLAYILVDTSIIQNKLTTVLGKYSLEIYVSHGLFLKLLKLEYIGHVGTYICIVILGTILMSIVLKKIHEHLNVCVGSAFFGR